MTSRPNVPKKGEAVMASMRIGACYKARDYGLAFTPTNMIQLDKIIIAYCVDEKGSN